MHWTRGTQEFTEDNWREYFEEEGKDTWVNPRALDKTFVAFQLAPYNRATHMKNEDWQDTTYYMSLENFVLGNWYNESGELNYDFTGEYVRKAGKDRHFHYTRQYKNKNGEVCSLVGEPVYTTI